MRSVFRRRCGRRSRRWSADDCSCALGDDVVDHYLNYARTEQRLFDEVVTCYERSGCSSVARPLIGITTYVTPAKWSYWDTKLRSFQRLRERGRARRGARVARPAERDGVEETLQALDGLLFSGGSDLDPGLYDQEAHEETFGIHEVRDRAELALLEAALERDMPVLAVCVAARC